ncbi:MAG TPA: HD domain-containing protein, partial [Candidatus Paceibacterota bacterium]|nr:HD domain-containing protein [Candidatus Paceibacterota bacterium]
NFLFEVGTMRKLPRIHRQVLLSDDTSDTISSHSYRAALIAWFLAKKEGADPYKTVMMSLLHDMEEARTADHNWVHKRYIKIFEDEVREEQMGTLPYQDMKEFLEEYKKRKSKEAIIAKQADVLDQILLLREYEWQGNKEAAIWLYGKRGGKEGREQINKLSLQSAKELGEAIYTTDPSAWWDNLATGINR